MKDIVKIVLKIISIYIFVRYVVNYAVSAIGIQIFQSGHKLDTFLYLLVSAVMFIAASLLLWIFSDKISSFICRGTNNTIKLDFDFDDIYPHLISIIGLILIVNTLPGILKDTANYFSIRNLLKEVSNPTDLGIPLSTQLTIKSDIISGIIKIVLALVLITGPKGIAALLKKAQNFGIYKGK